MGGARRGAAPLVVDAPIGGPGTTAQVNPRAVTEAVMDDAIAHGAELRIGVVDGLRFADDGAVRGVSVDGLPLIGPVPWAPGTFLATAHGSWGLLTAPATGRMVAEMILDGGSRSLDATPFALTRLPAGRM